MRVPMMSAGTRSGVNWRRANVPPTAVARVSTASVFATPGTPSSSTCPLASRATSIRSISRSWPTITRLISKSTFSSRAASTDGGTGASVEGAIGVLAALLTVLPGLAGHGRPESEGRRRDGRAIPGTSVLHLAREPRRWDGRGGTVGLHVDTTAPGGRALLAWYVRRAAPPVAARRLYLR